MGQYYYPASLDKMEGVYSHDFGSGLKLMEHSWVGNKFVGVVGNLISPGGKWYGDRIVWAGDYADHELNECGEETENNIYQLVRDNVIKPRFDESEAFKYLVNLDTNEWVDMYKLPVSEVYNGIDFVIHPLPLLTCEGNGRGGGDYHGNHSALVGKWARNRVVFQNEKPETGEELICDFVD